MCCCGYFVLLEGPKWEVIDNTPIWCDFGQSMGICPPGVTLYCTNTCCTTN